MTAYDTFTGRIFVKGKLTERGEKKRADIIIYYKSNIPVAVAEAKDNKHAVGAGMQQALEYANTLDIPVAISSNGDTQDFYKKGNYDYLVLLAGDSDFVPLVNGLSDDGVKTFVLYMDFSDDLLGTTQTAQALLDLTDIRVDIETLRRERVDEKIKSIFIDYQGTDDKADSSETPFKQAISATNPVTTEKKEKLIKSDNPFTKEQLIKAIKEKQSESCDGKNEYVLLAQVGLLLKEKTGIKLHGKVVTTIKKNFQNDFDIDKSIHGGERIRLKESARDTKGGAAVPKQSEGMKR